MYPQPQVIKENFNPADWEKVICTEVGEQAQCHNCKKITECKTVGEHIQCAHCKQFIWRKK